MKFYIYLGIAIGGALGGWIGTMLDHGNGFGPWSLLLSTVGGFGGLYIGYKFGKAVGN